MMPLAIRRTTRCTSCFTALLLMFSLFSVVTAGIAVAATVGDQVELKATHPAGVPFHGVTRIYTFNHQHFTRFAGIEVLTP